MRTTRTGKVIMAAAAVAAFLATGPLKAVDFLRGDANGDGAMTIADSHSVLMFLFESLVLEDCLGARDVNDDGRLNIPDGVWVLNTLFLGGPVPLAPIPDVGPLPEGALLACDEYGGGAPLANPTASLVVLEAVSSGGNGRTVITLGAANAGPVAGYSFQLQFPPGTVLESRERLADLTGHHVPFNEAGNWNSARLRDDVLQTALLFALTDRVAFEPSAEVVPIVEAVVCLAPGTPAGEYPLVLAAAEFVDADSSRSVHPARIDGVLRVEEDVVIPGDCSTPDVSPGPDPDRPQEPIGPTTRANNVTFRLADRAVLPGSTVDVPFFIRADGGLQGYAFSLDFDEETLTAISVAPVWEIPGGFEYSFGRFEFDNDNLTPGDGGVDEGVGVGAAVFDFTIHVAMPANEDVEAVRMTFDVAAEAEDAVTHVRFLDGGKVSGESVPNAVTSAGETLSPDLVESFVKVDCTLVLEANVDIATFRRGEVNADAAVNLTDAQYTLNFLFLGGPRPVCFDAMDANDDGKLDISDALRTLQFLFLGGTRLPAPYPDEGDDPTADGMTCGQRNA